jgi:signal transduction histidine kinase
VPGAKVAFTVDVEDDLPPVRVDRDQIQQLLLNLLKNAEEAMGERGGVRLAVFREGDRVVFAVDDEGPGVPPSQRERIFEPYVTGRPEGTGLGLAIARRIAEEHGGSLQAEDAPTGGARFALRLPAAAPASSAAG